MTGCEPAPNCLAPIHPDQRTRDWLKTLNPPDYVNEYFHKIGEQQKAIDEVCK